MVMAMAVVVSSTLTLKFLKVMAATAMAKLAFVLINVGIIGVEEITDSSFGGLADIAASRGFEFLLALLFVIGLMTRRITIPDPKEAEKLDKIVDKLDRIERKVDR